jgi:hypothetical protein
LQQFCVQPWLLRHGSNAQKAAFPAKAGIHSSTAATWIDDPGFRRNANLVHLLLVPLGVVDCYMM